MTPNVSVLLQRWNVAEVIGKNLVLFKELNMRRKDGTPVGYTRMVHLEQALGRPWWVVHRAHLHEGLATVAKQLGAKIELNARVVEIDHEDMGKAVVKTFKGTSHTFNLCVGADGLNSVVRKTLFPSMRPEPPTTNCAYRALVPFERIRQDPIAKELIKDLTMEVWMAHKSYIITYPINAGQVLNLVLSHHWAEKLRAMQPDVSIEEMRSEYKDYDERIRRIVDMIPEVVSYRYGQAHGS